MTTLQNWAVVDANNNLAPPDGWPENTMQYSDVNNAGRAVQGTVRRFFGDINGSLQAAGAVNAYTVALNESGYAAYFQGMYFVCEIPITNTGAVTLNVNGIGVQAVVDRAGQPLTTGEIQAGGIYEFRYDGTNFQLMGSVAGGAATLDSITLTSTDAVDLVDADAPFLTGPGTGQHLEFDRNDIQSKSDATTASNLDLNRFGGALNLGAQSGIGAATLYADGAIAAAAPGAGTFNVLSVGNTDAENRAIIGKHQDGTDRFTIGQLGDGQLRFRNQVHGERVLIQGENLAGSVVQLFNADPDGVATIYEDGNDRLDVDSLGVVIRQDANVDTTDYRLRFQHDNQTDRGLLGFLGSTIFRIRNQIHGGDVRLEAEDAGGVNRSLVNGDPDGRVEIHHPASAVVRIGTTADGIDIQKNVNNDSGNNLLRFEHLGGTTRGLIGHIATDFDVRNLVHGGLVILRAEDTGGTLRNGLIIDPDVDTTIFHPPTSEEAARTIVPASGGLEANNTLTGAGYERVLTTSDQGIVPIDDICTADQNIASSTILTASTFLQGFVLAANTEYTIEAHLKFDSASSTPNAQFAFAFAAGGSSYFSHTHTGWDTNGGNNAGAHSDNGLTTEIVSISANDEVGIILNGVIRAGGVGATVELRWSQNISNAVATVLRQGSWIRFTPITP